MDDLSEEIKQDIDYTTNIIKSMVDMLIVLNPDGTIRTINPATENILEYSSKELIGKNFGVILEKELIISPKKQEFIGKGEKIFLTKTGKKMPVFFSGSVMRDTQGTVDGIVCIAMDITARKKLEDELLQKEWRLSGIIDDSHVGTWEWNVQSGKTVFNDIWAQIVGYTLEELEPISIKTWEALAHPDDIKTSRELLVRHFEGALPYYDVECRIKHKNGHWIWVHDRGKVVSWTADGKPLMMFGTHTDITTRKQAEEALRESEHKLQTFFEFNPDPTAITDINTGQIFEINQAFITWSGYSKDELIGKTTNELQIWTNPDDRDRLLHLLGKQGFLDNIETRVRIKDGSVRDVLFSVRFVDVGSKHFLMSRAQDITERKLQEKELQKNQKLESLGVLAGGIAHDFNNLMSSIFGYIDMANEESKDSKVTSYLSIAMNTIDRARALTQQLLTFAKGGAPVQQIGNLFPFVQETVQFVLSGSKVSCHFDVQQDLWACNFDKNQIGQVIDNLIINSMQAMPGGGTIGLSAQNIVLEEKEHPILSKGKYIKISIKDCGVGIPNEFLVRIFDPFFTTKAKGHGLGLSISFSIIKRHGGCLEVESKAGIGTTFYIYLPASEEVVLSSKENTGKLLKGSGRILVMDDDLCVLKMTATMLSGLGYEVLCAESGEVALKFFINEIRAGRKIDAMIFDLTVKGGVGGVEALASLRKQNKEIPVFVASGYTNDPVIMRPEEYGFTASLAKPFRLEELAKMLNKYKS